jgi:hypothetical protein
MCKVVGVSVPHNFQTGKNEIKLLTEYQSETWSFICWRCTRRIDSWENIWRHISKWRQLQSFSIGRVDAERKEVAGRRAEKRLLQSVCKVTIVKCDETVSWNGKPGLWNNTAEPCLGDSVIRPAE